MKSGFAQSQQITMSFSAKAALRACDVFFARARGDTID
jgi:hypothetical protein